MAKRGSGLPAPNGATRSSACTRSTEAAGTRSIPSTFTVGTTAASLMAAATRSPRKLRRPSTLPRATVNPAAMECPPPLISNPDWAAAMTADPRSTPVTDRPDPIPVSPSSETTHAGRLKRSVRRLATMPTTPGCHPAPAAKMRPASPSPSPDSSTIARA